ncbi:MAG: LysE family translocator [Flavobacteriaceae bacterium]
MSLEIVLAALWFAMVAAISPGPNNILLLTSGVNFGFARTIPHILGACGGAFVLQQGIGFGIGALLEAYPPVHLGLKVAGAAYLIYLAWRTAATRSMATNDGQATPLTPLQAAGLIWINPKAWVVSITAISIFATVENPYIGVLTVSLAFLVANLLCNSAWAGFGIVLRNWLADPVRLKWFNITMGVMLLATLWPLLK